MALVRRAQRAGRSMGEDGNIVATLDGQELSVVPVTGGRTRVLANPQQNGLRSLRFPQLLPGSEFLIATAAGTDMISFKRQVSRRSMWIRQPASCS